MVETKYFFTYPREDAALVLRLAQDLRDASVDVWMDQLSIRGGQRWDVAVQQALESCQRMIAVLSPHSLASETVMDEISYALDARKLVIPIVIQSCEIPFRLLRVQHIDFNGDYDRGLAQLLRAIQDAPPDLSRSLKSDHRERLPRKDSPIEEVNDERGAPLRPARVDRRPWSALLGGAIGVAWGASAMQLFAAPPAIDPVQAVAATGAAGAICGAIGGMRLNTAGFALAGLFVGGVAFALLAHSPRPREIALAAPAGAVASIVLCALLVSWRRWRSEPAK